LAKYGDGSEVEMPIPVKMNQLATMSFSGLGTHVKFKLFDKLKGGKLAVDAYEREITQINFEQLLNICSAAQFSGFY
jgi:tRNA A37 threonylcarbamoyltransferase TsaD